MWWYVVVCVCMRHLLDVGEIHVERCVVVCSCVSMCEACVRF